jgi:hypothetical protein
VASASGIGCYTEEMSHMAEYAPDAIQRLSHHIIRTVPGAVFSGIVGDASHTYGYHRSRNWNIASGEYGSHDYSVQLTQDCKGDGDAAAALDISFPPDMMKLVTRRLIHAMRHDDARLRAVRELFGTVDGTTVTGWDRHHPDRPTDDTWTSSDDTHLWHVHLSFYREFATDTAALAPVVNVFAGNGSHEPDEESFEAEPVQPKPLGPHPAWPLPAGHYFGLASGPAKSHGGFFVWERPYVRRIQRRMIKLGFVPGVRDVESDWADGVFERPTKDAVAAWQLDKWATETTRFGEVWPDDWIRLQRAK